MRILTRLAAPVALLALVAGASDAADVKEALRTLRAVGPEGDGNEAASAAWQELAQADVNQVPQLLAAIDGANPLAANWIRTAVDTVCERALRDEGTLPKKALEQFMLQTVNRSGSPMGSLAVGALLCILVALVPIVGWTFLLVLILSGMGAAVIAFVQRAREHSPAVEEELE